MQDYRIRIYERYASSFQDASPQFNPVAASRWTKGYDYYLRNWLPVDKAADILDVACGGGKLLHFFKERGYTRVNGVDISPEQVSLARQVIPNVIEANAVDFLESHQGAFDLITGLDIVRTLQEGGNFAISRRLLWSTAEWRALDLANSQCGKSLGFILSLR